MAISGDECCNIILFYKSVDHPTRERDVDVSAATREIVTQDVRFNNRVGSRLGL